MNYSKQILILFLLLSTVTINAQHKDSTKVYIYEPFKSGQTVDTKKDIKVDQNCIKWNWSLLGRGVFAINYEHLITSKLSFEIGAGLTYRDFLFEASRGDDFSSNSETNVKLGPYFEGNIRFYPGEGDLEGFYVSPFVRYRSYNIEKTIENIYPAGYSMTDVGFNIGVQRELWSTGMMVESYFGVAYRNRIFDDISVDYGSSTVVTQNKTKDWIPAINLGFKIGIPF